MRRLAAGLAAGLAAASQPPSHPPGQPAESGRSLGRRGCPRPTAPGGPCTPCCAALRSGQRHHVVQKHAMEQRWADEAAAAAAHTAQRAGAAGRPAHHMLRCAVRTRGARRAAVDDAGLRQRLLQFVHLETDLGGACARLRHQVLGLVACHARPGGHGGRVGTRGKGTRSARQCGTAQHARAHTPGSLSSNTIRPSKSLPHHSTSCLKRVCPRSGIRAAATWGRA